MKLKEDRNIKKIKPKTNAFGLQMERCLDTKIKANDLNYLCFLLTKCNENLLNFCYSKCKLTKTLSNQDSFQTRSV